MLHKYTCLKLTNTSIDGVVLESRHGHLNVVAAAAEPLPNGVDSGDLFHRPGTAKAVRECLQALPASGKRVLLTIPGAGVLLKRVEMPAFSLATAAQRDAAIDLELPDHISIPLETATYDWAVMNESAEISELLIVWMRKSPLTALVDQLEQIGVQPIYALPSSLVVADQLLQYTAVSQRRAGVCFDGNQVELAVVEDGQIMGGRSFAIPDSAPALWRMVEQSLASIPNPNAATLEQITQFDAADVAALSLTPEQVMQQLDIPHFNRTALGNEWASSLVRGYLRKGVAINLLKPLLEQKADARKQRRTQAMKQFLPFATTLGMVLANLVFWQASQSTQNRVEELRQIHDTAQIKSQAIPSLKKVQDVLDDQLAVFAWTERSFPVLSHRLKIIAESIPKSVRLTTVKTDTPPRSPKGRSAFDAREKLLLIGLATSQAEMDKFRVALIQHGAFDTVRQIKTEPTTFGGERWLQFTFSLVSQPSEAATSVQAVVGEKGD
jgi:hypothetical protein